MGINKKIGLVLAGLLVVAGVVVFRQSNGGLSGSKDSDYVAVYMNSGDVYFGQLARFPKLTLANAYTLQRTDDQNTPFTLVKFKEAFWGPQGDIELSEDNVLWIAELGEDSQVLKSIREQEAAGK
jgi:hypothetical protein